MSLNEVNPLVCPNFDTEFKADDSKLSYLEDYRWAFTINPSSKKRFNGIVKSGSISYGQLDKMNQKKILETAVMNAIGIAFFTGGPTLYEVHYELTKKGNVHAHGIITATRLEINTFQEDLNKTLGLPNVPAERLCCIDFLMTKNDVFYWILYMRKGIYCDRTKRDKELVNLTDTHDIEVYLDYFDQPYDKYVRPITKRGS